MEEGYIISKDGGFVCLLCHNYTPRMHSIVKRHWEQAHKNHIVEFEGKAICLCKKLCRKRGHYHCICGCGSTFDKKDRFVQHLESLKNVVLKNVMPSSTGEESACSGSISKDTPASAHSPCGNPDVNQASGNKKKAPCPHCGLLVWKKNLTTHIARAHMPKDVAIKKYAGSCVDAGSGIFLVSERLTGVHHVIHVQKYILGNQPPVIFCESKQCEYKKIIAGVSGNPSYECDHLRSVPFYGPPLDFHLDVSVLDILVEEKRIDAETKADCLQQKHEAESWGMELVNSMVDMDSSDRYIFISVWTGTREYYSRLERVSLTFDRLHFDLVCGCSGSSRISCRHKPIAKWFLRCVHPDAFMSVGESAAVKNVTSLTLSSDHHPLVEYVYNEKSVPFALPDEYVHEKVSSELVVVPVEDYCARCHGKLDLKECKHASKVLSRFGFINLAKVWVKICGACSIEYWYSEIKDGIFNFNNKFFITYDYLIWLRNGLLQHTALSRELNILERHYKVTINHDLVRRCFYKFLALSDDRDLFRCPLCGIHPVILSFDVNRKCAFKLESVDESSANNVDKVNGRKFWDDVKKHAISYSLGPTESVAPSMEYWAPYVAEGSRNGDEVYNTEFRKGTQDTDEQQFLECLSEESLESLLQTDLSTLKELCKQCGISGYSKLSRTSCIVHLKSALRSKVKIDKFFFKVWNSSGGLLTATCPHGIVYAFKSLLKPESPRDIGDLLLSMKHSPTVVISDIPHMLAAHMNKRSPNFFNPFDGRVADPNEENIKSVVDGKFKPISYPWLNKRMEKAITNLKLEGTSIHPITLVVQRFSLYDKFHQGNTSQKKEFLRRTSYIKELDGVITETAEQLNSFLSKSLYFLDCLAPLHYLLVVKESFSLRNYEISSKIIGNKPHSFDVYGRVMYNDGYNQGKVDIRPPTATGPALPNQPVVPPTDVESNSISSGNVHFDVYSSIVINGTDQHPMQCQLDPKVQKKRVDGPSREDVIKNKRRRLATRVYTNEECAFFNKIKSLFKGLHNPLNNCWFNSVLFAVRNTLGSSRLYEDLLFQPADEVDGYHVSLQPVLESLSLSSTTDILQPNILSECLRSHFSDVISVNIGEENDPNNFFLHSSGMIDNNCVTIFNSSTVYEIKIQSKYHCLNCREMSVVNHCEGCLSLALAQGMDTADILHLLKQYFEDELFERPCERCGSKSAGIGKKIINIPQVLAIHLKRYDANFVKSQEFVTPSALIDLSDGNMMEAGTEHCKYVLRSVITHKGESISNGHYTTTIYESTNDMYIELDGTTAHLSPCSQSIYSGGYILLYENKNVMEMLVSKWYPLVLLMSLLIRLNKVESSIMNDFLIELWHALNIDSLKNITALIDLFSAKMARRYTIVQQSNSNIEILKYILQILGFKEERKCYFLLRFVCEECQLHQAHVAVYNAVSCSEASITEVVAKVADNFQLSECYECQSMLESNDSPVFLSDVLFVSTDADVSVSDLFSHWEPMLHSVVDFYSVSAVLCDNMTIIPKDGLLFQASADRKTVVLANQTCLVGRKVIVLEGQQLATSCNKFLGVDITEVPVGVKQYVGCIEEDRMKLDICLSNVVDDAATVQPILYQGEVTTEFCQCFYNSVFNSSVFYVTYKSMDVFLEASIGLVLSSIQMQRLHKFILFDLNEAFYLVTDCRLYCVGKFCQKAVMKILQISEFIGEANAQPRNVVTVLSNHCWRKIEFLRVTYSLIAQQELAVEEADCIHTVIAIIFAIKQADGGHILSNAIREECSFSDCVQLLPPKDVKDILCADLDCLFMKSFPCSMIVNKVKNRYLEHGIGVLREDLCRHVLDFIMREKEVIKDYYYLTDNVDASHRRRIKGLLGQQKYKDIFRRQILCLKTYEKLRKCFPVMLIKCMQETLLVLLTDATSKTVVDNGIMKYGYFRQFDYIELVILKLVLSMYIVETAGEKVCDVLKETGELGEDI